MYGSELPQNLSSVYPVLWKQCQDFGFGDRCASDLLDSVCLCQPFVCMALPESLPCLKGTLRLTELGNGGRRVVSGSEGVGGGEGGLGSSSVCS